MNKCKNCGHKEERHAQKSRVCLVTPCSNRFKKKRKFCKCKKFEGEYILSREFDMGYKYSKDEKNQGCGEWWGKEIEPKHGLCPKCQDNSPLVQEKSDDMPKNWKGSVPSSSEDKEPEDLTQEHESGSFNLSDKIESLPYNGFEVAFIAAIDVKESVKILIEYIESTPDPQVSKIKEIFGEKLI